MNDVIRVDLHRHLEGSLRPSHLAEVLARSNRPDMDPGALRKAVTVDDTIESLIAYLGRIDNAAAILTTLDDWVDAGTHAVEDAYDDGLDYLELRFSPWFISRQTGLHPSAVVEAVSEGVSVASGRTGVPVGLIATVVRDLGPESAMQQVDTILETCDVWCGIDLAGDEAGVPCAAFAPAFARARDAGLHVTVHAGEAAGPHSVADALPPRRRTDRPRRPLRRGSASPRAADRARDDPGSRADQQHADACIGGVRFTSDP